MKSLILSIVAAAGLIGGGAAAIAAKTAPSEDVKTMQVAEASGEKKICKRPQVSATRRSERICLTKEEWKKIEAMD